jgi:hypothetical protein
VSYFVDAEDGQAYGGANADTKKDFYRSRPFRVRSNSFELSLTELLAGELTNVVDENVDGLVESLVA